MLGPIIHESMRNCCYTLCEILGVVIQKKKCRVLAQFGKRYMVGWHHRLNRHEFEKAPEDGDG